MLFIDRRKDSSIYIDMYYVAAVNMITELWKMFFHIFIKSCETEYENLLTTNSADWENAKVYSVSPFHTLTLSPKPSTE